MTRQRTTGIGAQARIGMAGSSRRRPRARSLSPAILSGVIGGTVGEQNVAGAPSPNPTGPTTG